MLDSAVKAIEGIQKCDILRKEIATIQEKLGQLKGSYVGCPECGNGLLCWRHTKVLHRLENRKKAVNLAYEQLP